MHQHRQARGSPHAVGPHSPAAAVGQQCWAGSAATPPDLQGSRSSTAEVPRRCHLCAVVCMDTVTILPPMSARPWLRNPQSIQESAASCVKWYVGVDPRQQTLALLDGVARRPPLLSALLTAFLMLLQAYSAGRIQRLTSGWSAGRLPNMDPNPRTPTQPRPKPPSHEPTLTWTQSCLGPDPDPSTVEGRSFDIPAKIYTGTNHPSFAWTATLMAGKDDPKP